jgi:predicted O-methyltransferase YrrM
MINNSNPLPQSLRTALADRKVFSPKGERVDLHSNVSDTEALELYEAIRELKPELSLEVGFAQAVSAQAILQALEDNGAGHHHVMDPFQANYDDCGLEMVRRAGLEHRMTFHRKFAEEVIPGLPEVGFAFIDASHLFDLTISEFVLTDKKLKIGGVVAFHDMWMPAQQALIRYILANRSYRVFRPAKSPAPGEGPSQSMLKAAVRRACAALPRAEKVFRPDFLTPWSELRLANLVFLQKTGKEQREWTFHRQF